MGRILAIDFGTKRTGLAWTDPMQISINPLDAVSPEDAFLFIGENIQELDTIVIGMPLEPDASFTNSTQSIINFTNRIKNSFPDLRIEEIDESYTSREAREYMIHFGYKKKDREKKENVDKIAAAIILQRYLDLQP